jgi:hypothetical protein
VPFSCTSAGFFADPAIFSQKNCRFGYYLGPLQMQGFLVVSKEIYGSRATVRLSLPLPPCCK